MDITRSFGAILSGSGALWRGLLSAAVVTTMLTVTLLGAADTAHAQDLDLLINDGTVIDPKNDVNAVMDVGIAGDTIAVVAENVSPDRAEQVVDASGHYVTPGLIDIHGHVFHGTEEDAYLSNSYSALKPDAHTFRAGTTTIVDVGGPGWRNIGQFVNQTVEHSETRVLAFINIVGAGMKGMPEQNLRDMNPRMTAMAAEQYSDVVVGVKLAHYRGHDWTPTERAVEAGERADIPVMVDFGGASPPLSIEELFFDYLRPGDIFTHAYALLDQQNRRQSIVDEQHELRPFVPKAQERGIKFGVGHGGGSFDYDAAVPATQAGLWPNAISTDLHDGSMNDGMKNMTNVMSKMLALGMGLEEVIRASTWQPAQIIQRPELGNLDVGAPADVAVLDLRKGSFGFVDVDGDRREGAQKLVTELTVRAGDVVWDLNGLAASEWNE
ncbi:MAG: amidohydrolase/deacetylase family metallohydrolase [Salinibacter sp.]|uniref:amidohydrolase/deacetylase family metallohydrolase n=1 Tax=Salinibacter sp. TaxID=2065818 RepID=UPI002FC30E05